MLAIRPTFSESWYRVKTLRAKLRASAQISRQHYRGERWYVVRDPAGNQYHRLSDAAYRFVGLLDGTRTVEEAWDLVGGQLADDAPTQPEVIQILTHLYGANLIDADVTPDATVLLRRQKKQKQKKLQGKLMQAMFPRIPLWDPDRFLVRWLPLAKAMISKTGMIIWLVTVFAALILVLPHWEKLKTQAGTSIDMVNNPFNAFWLWLVFVLIKFIHELGHAFSCRRFGGECHEMGIMFLVFIPTPYVDASSAWSFPNKWHRIFVGSGGMIIEMFVAALCAFIWLVTNENSLPNQLAYNAMLVASVTTIIFNANPLLRYDGYYILSDYLEIPNLRQKSAEYTLGLVKRHIFRVKQTQPLPSIVQRIELFFYHCTSVVYRTVIGIVIILVVTWQIPVLGVLMAIGGLVTWLVMPAWKLFKYLALEPELHRKRGRATAFCAAVAAVIIIVIGVLKFSVHIEERGIVEPFAKQQIVPRGGGEVIELLVKDGQMVQAGDVILRMEDKRLEAELRREQARLTGQRARYMQAMASDAAQARIELGAIELLESAVAEKKQQLADLEVKAPIAGRLVAPGLEQAMGIKLKRGEAIGQISAEGPLVVKTALRQEDYQVLRRSEILATMNGGDESPIEVRLAGAVGTVLKGVELTIYDSVQPELPHAALGQAGGSDIAVDPSDQSGKKPLIAQYEARIQLDVDDKQYVPGQRATVRFRTEREPLAWNWWRRFEQLINVHRTDTWL